MPFFLGFNKGFGGFDSDSYYIMILVTENNYTKKLNMGTLGHSISLFFLLAYVSTTKKDTYCKKQRIDLRKRLFSRYNWEPGKHSAACTGSEVQ